MALTVKERSERNARLHLALGKAEAGSSLKQATAEMSAIVQRESEAYPDFTRAGSCKCYRARICDQLSDAANTLLLMGAVGLCS